MKSIAILGAGPSGLMLGRLLHLAKINYTIFERDPSEVWAIGRGGTLDIHTGSGQLALKEAGLFEQFRRLARYDASTVIADAEGKVHIRLGEGEDGNPDRPEIDRKDLRAILLDSLPAGAVQWNSRVQQVVKDPDGSMSVHLASGVVKSGYELVVGADGAWSRVRSLVTAARPEYSGFQYLTTAIRPGNPVYPSVQSMAGNGNYMALGTEKMLAAQKLGDGSYYIGVGLRLAETWISENAAVLKDPSALRGLLLREYFSEWPTVHTDLIEYSEGDFHSWPLYAMPTESLSWKTVPGIVLIGDAAHVTTPFEGEGVNCAMYDSLQLARQITSHGLEHLQDAVSDYEKDMFPRAIDLIQRCANNGELLFSPNAPQSFLEAVEVAIRNAQQRSA